MKTYRHRLTIAIKLITAMFMVAVLISSSALAVENQGVGGKPANPDPNNPRSESIFVYELGPGAEKSDAVRIINNSEEKRTISIYAVDSQKSSDGAFACAQKADTAVGVGTWITLSENEATLDTGTYEDVPFNVVVPTTASAGEQNGCIVIQDTTIKQSSDNGVVLSFRSAIRVAITVPGEITKSLSYTGAVSINDSSTDKLGLMVGLINNGNVSLDTTVDVSVNTIFGPSVASVNGTYPVLSGSQSTLNFEVDKPFWGGWYSVASSATYMDNTADSLGESGGHTSTITSPKKWVYVSPQPLAMIIEIIVLALIVIIIFALIVKYIHRKKVYKRAHSYTVQPGDTLQRIAKSHDVSWKKIASYNKIKPPYHLEEGHHIKIPGSKKQT